MARFKIFLPILAGALMLVAAFGVISYQTVFAQQPTPTTPQTTPPQADGKAPGVKNGPRDEYLAKALGITTDELNTAQQAALTEALKQAVDQGLITQAQADALAQHEMRGLGGWGAELFERSGIDYQALLAKALNISTDDLKAAVAKAQTTAIDDAVAAGTITQEQADLMKGRLALKDDTTFGSAIRSAYEAAINDAVSRGVITQAQGDALLNALKNYQGGFLPFGGRGGHGGPGGFGGRHHKDGGFWPGLNPNPATPGTQTPEGTSGL